jgi:hypothetical protein
MALCPVCEVLLTKASSIVMRVSPSNSRYEAGEKASLMPVFSERTVMGMMGWWPEKSPYTVKELVGVRR